MEFKRQIVVEIRRPYPTWSGNQLAARSTCLLVGNPTLVGHRMYALSEELFSIEEVIILVGLFWFKLIIKNVVCNR